MNSSDLVKLIGAPYGLVPSEARAIVECIFGAIGDAAARGEDVTISKFGTFRRKAIAPRSGRHPRTGDAITIAASARVSFRASKGLKDKLSN